jgi:gliding motility-associated-like protein
MMGVLHSFTAKVILIFTVIFMMSSAVPVGEDPQVIKLCDTSFVLKKYSVLPPNGYFNTWSVSPEVITLGGFNENILTIKWTEPGSYTIVAQFSNGLCISENQLDVVVEGCPETTLYIPNTFTPNNDNDNEVFGAYGLNIKDFNMLIFNRWGEQIFTSNTIDNRWNGYYNGKLCQEDVYVYKISYRGGDDKLNVIYGRVLLLY